MTRRRRRWSLAALGWALLIVVFGTLPTEAIIRGTAGADREVEATMAGHFVEYSILAVLVMAALGGWRARPRSVLLSLALAVSLGGGIEILQAFLPYRDCQVDDVVVNSLGSAAGLAVSGAASALRAR